MIGIFRRMGCARPIEITPPAERILPAHNDRYGKDLVHYLCALGERGPDLVTVDRFCRRQARGHQLAETRKQLGLGQKRIAAAMGVSVARVSQIEHGEVTSFEVIARYVEALGGRLDLVADFGDRTVRLPVTDTAAAA
jgi:DNA-binding XRE family transcriptional regulator